MAKTKILIIAGDTKVASKGEAALKRLGYRFVKTTPALDQSIQLIEKQKTDIVINIPGKENVKAFVQKGDEIRSKFNIPVIYLASEKSKTILKRAKLQERFDYLSDSFGDHELYFAIETALSRREYLQAKPHQDVLSTVRDFGKFLAFAPIAYIVIDEHSIIQFVNIHVEELLGFTHTELIGKNFEMLIPERFRTSHATNKKKYLAQPKKRAAGVGPDAFCLRHDGTEIPVEIGLNPVTLEGKTYVLASLSDISARIKSEESLRKAEAKYRTLVEKIPPIVYVTELEQHIGVNYISPQIETLGFGQEEWVADPELWFKQIHPEDQARVLTEIQQGMESGKPFRSEYRLMTRTGDAKWFLDEAVDIFDNDGSPLYRQGFMLDISARKAAEEALSSRQRYLALLNDMTHAILLSADFDSTLEILSVNMAKLIDADDCYITRWDENKQLAIAVVTTAKLERPYSEYVPEDQPTDELSMTASVLKAGHALAADDVFNSPYLGSEIANNFPACSVLGVPLIVGEHKLGAAMIAFNTPHHFTSDEIERAEYAANQIALALWNFEQSMDIQRRLKESNALAEIGRALSETEHVGTGEILQLIVDSARDLMPHAERSVIHLLEADEKALIARAVSGFDAEDKDRKSVKMRLGEGVAGQVIHEGVTINIEDIRNNPTFLLGDSLPIFRSLLVAPIQSGRQQIGTISVQSDQIRAFSKEDTELIDALAVQAAIAIENTRLFEMTQQRLKEVNALYQISRRLAASLDADQLIRDMIGLLQQNFGYYHVQLYLIDPETRDLVVKHGSGYIGNELLQKHHSLPAGEGIVGHVAETGEQFITNNVDEVVFFKRNILLPDTQSEIAIPIKIAGQVVGVLDIQNTASQRFTDSDLQLMTAIADQLAVVLQKANLYTVLQTALKQEQTVRSQLVQSERLALVGRLLASVSHELNNPLQAIQNALFLLKDEVNLSQQARQDLDVILSEAERMAALIERLRSAYRPLRIKDFRPVDLNSLIEDVHTLITTHMRQKEIVFEFYPDTDLPPVSGLPDQIRQVALNLFLNAIEVMKPGGRLAVLTRYLPQQNEALFTVKDNGPGIDAEILPQIFDAFITSKHTGTGLGLTITHDIIQQHHGRIEAENDPDGGALFNIWLPIHERG